jgi:hypothetical protein
MNRLWWFILTISQIAAAVTFSIASLNRSIIDLLWMGQFDDHFEKCQTLQIFVTTSFSISFQFQSNRWLHIISLSWISGVTLVFHDTAGVLTGSNAHLVIGSAGALFLKVPLANCGSGLRFCGNGRDRLFDFWWILVKRPVRTRKSKLQNSQILVKSKDLNKVDPVGRDVTFRFKKSGNQCNR